LVGWDKFDSIIGSNFRKLGMFIRTQKMAAVDRNMKVLFPEDTD
jgi:hypothetical protein